MLKFVRQVPPWVWVSMGAVVITTGVGVGAWIYQRAVFNTLAGFKEQVFERVQWQNETNLRFDREQMKRDNTFRGQLENIEQEWK